MRTMILDHSMGTATARCTIQQLDGDVPWESCYDFTKSMAALSCVFESELKCRTHVGGAQLRRLLYNATSPSRMQWHFNNLRHRHSLPPWKLALLGSGSSPNEAFNREINDWFRNQPDIYISTVEVQLGASALGKLMAHNWAMYYPTLRQARPSSVLHRVVASLSVPDQDWNSWCQQLLRPGVHRISAAVLPPCNKRQATARTIKEHGSREPSGVPRQKKPGCKERVRKDVVMMKKPAAKGVVIMKKPAAKRAVVVKLPMRRHPKPVKRTPFNLKRI